MGKPADTSVGFVYPEGGSDNDIGVYKQPEIVANVSEFKPGNCLNEANISLAGISKGNVQRENPYGSKEMRGYGAATKGKKISGKQG